MNKFKDIFNEHIMRYVVEKNYYYKIPKDKEQLLYDFFLIDLFKTHDLENVLNDTDKDSKKMSISDTTIYSYKEIKKEVASELREEFLSVVFFLLAGVYYRIFEFNKASELKTFFADEFNAKDFISKYARRIKLATSGYGEIINNDDDEEIKKQSEDKPEVYKLIYKALIDTKVPKEKIVEMMSKSFEKLSWKSNRVVVPAEIWKDLADSWLELYKAKNDNDMFNAINKIYDIQFKNNSILGMSKIIYKAGRSSDWFEDAMKVNINKQTPWEIWNKSTGGLKSMFAEIIKGTGHGSVEDFVKNIKNMGFKSVTSYQKSKLKYGNDSNYDGKGESFEKHIEMVKKILDDMEKTDFTKLSYTELRNKQVELENMRNKGSLPDELNKVYLNLQQELIDAKNEIIKKHKDEEELKAKEKAKTMVHTAKDNDWTQENWWGGTWKSGGFKGSKWHDGVWHDGVWKGDVFVKGKWENGTWKHGLFGKDAIWLDGSFEGGTFKGTWHGGVFGGKFYTPIFDGGTWFAGTWLGGKFIDGIWKSGNWKGGVWDSGTWESGTWYGGIWNGGTWKKGYIWDGKKLVYSTVSPDEFMAKKYKF